MIYSLTSRPEYWKGLKSSRHYAIVNAILALGPKGRLTTFVLLELLNIYTLICQIIRPYFGNDSLKIINANTVQGFNIWGSLKAVPQSSIVSFTYSKALIKIRTTMGTLRVPLASLWIEHAQVQELTEHLDQVLNRRSVV